MSTAADPASSPVRRTMGLSRTATGLVVPSAARRAMTRVRDNDPLAAWIGTIVVTLQAAFLRLWNLDYPHSLLFDETYYAKDAWSLVHHGYVTGYVKDANSQILAGHPYGLWTKEPSMIVHPDLGKWIIGSGEAMFGMTPFGWRIASAVVGSLMVLVMIRLARRVTGSTLLGLTAGVLMTFDGMQFVLSRLALLDIFLAFFILCAVSCLVADRDWVRARLARLVPAGERLTPGSWGPRMLWRPWRLAAGIWWGLACATKWDAIYPLAALGILVWAWDAGARRSFGVRLAWLKAALIDAVPAFGYLVVLPLVMYLLTWTGWLLHAHQYELFLSDTQYGRYWGSYLKHHDHGLAAVVHALRSLWHYHLDVWTFHTKFLNTSTHPYQSNPEGWLVMSRPVGIDAQLGIKPGAQGCPAPVGSSCLRQILLLGTPILWWFSSIAALWSVFAWIGKRDWRYGLVTVGVLSTWLPWIKFDNRPIFSYYAMATLPFLILGATMLLGEILGQGAPGSRRRQLGATAAGAIVVVVMLNFAWFWPIYTDGLITQQHWQERIWFKKWI
ncbi:MAG: phospholipid carrier-dependent glycosyltransferase [Actinomycetota bacterium]|nr:phospholipid carrier-dependent glycosyltransferase [Actinomycetota bacterium]